MRASKKTRFYSQGGGCGIGLGFGWGIFAFAIGTPVMRLEKLLGRNERILDEAKHRLDSERAAGKRAPFKAGLPDEMRTSDPLLDRIIRGILVRRAKMGEMSERRARFLQPKGAAP